jgi:hypothetical protein
VLHQGPPNWGASPAGTAFGCAAAGDSVVVDPDEDDEEEVDFDSTAG